MKLMEFDYQNGGRIGCKVMRKDQNNNYNFIRDSQSAIHLARNQNIFHRRSKQIDIKYNFIGDEVEHKRVILKKIDTKNNLTDMMTKPLPTTKFDLCVDLVGLAPCLK